jgi:LuxR family transcriptional regulator, regulator of acetate metabolism
MCVANDDDDVFRMLAAQASGLCGTADVDVLAARACRMLRRFPGVDLAALAAVRDGHTLELVASSGHTPIDGGLSRRVMAGAAAVLVGDLAIDPGRGAVAGDPELRLLAAGAVRSVACVPLTFDGQVVGVLYVGSRDRHVIDESDLTLLCRFAALLAPLLMTCIRAGHAREQAVLAERMRIAQSLHDSSAAMLFDIRLTAQAMQREGGIAEDKLREWAAEIERDAGAVARELRQHIRELQTVDSLPLAAGRLVRSFTERSGTPAELLVLGRFSPSPASVDGALMSALREALRNVESHARATSAVVTLDYSAAGTVVLAVADDGSGMAPGTDLDVLIATRRGLGLAGISNAVERLGGDFSAARNEDGGLTVRMAVPLVRDPDAWD